MKKRCLLAVLLAVFMAAPLTAAYALESNAGVEIRAVAAPEYEFTAPSKTDIENPGAKEEIGFFEVGDLFLESNEWLEVTAICGEMTLGGGGLLPYTAQFNPPAGFDASASGSSYAVALCISPEDFAAAKAGRYEGTLLFRVISQPGGRVVWEGNTYITIKKSSLWTRIESAVQEGPPFTHPPLPDFWGGGDIPLTGGKAAWAALLACIPLLLTLLAFTAFAISPTAGLVADNLDGTYTISWGFKNRTLRKRLLAADSSRLNLIAGEIISMKLVEGGKDIASPPTVFERGIVKAVFETVVKEGTVVEWEIGSRRKRVDLSGLNSSLNESI